MKQEAGRHGLRAILGETKEHRLARLFRRVGPFVAVGRPDEQLSELGAARIYVGTEHWRLMVDDLMLRAAVVVVQAAETSGLRWECHRLVSRVKPAAVILFLPFQLRAVRARRVCPLSRVGGPGGSLVVAVITGLFVVYLFFAWLLTSWL